MSNVPFILESLEDVGSSAECLAEELEAYLSKVKAELQSYRRRFQTRLEETLQIHDQIEEEEEELAEEGLQPEGHFLCMKREKEALQKALEQTLEGLGFIIEAINNPI